VIQISEAVVTLELKKKDIENLLERENLLLKQFKETVSDDKFAEYLTKVYKKKIKRSKKKANNRPGIIYCYNYYYYGPSAEWHDI